MRGRPVRHVHRLVMVHIRCPTTAMTAAIQSAIKHAHVNVTSSNARPMRHVRMVHRQRLGGNTMVIHVMRRRPHVLWNSPATPGIKRIRPAPGARQKPIPLHIKMVVVLVPTKVRM